MPKKKKPEHDSVKRGSITVRNVDKVLWARAGAYAKRCGKARWTLLEEALRLRLVQDC